MRIEAGRLSSKGQLVIPKSMRDELNFEEGDDLILVQKGHLLIIKKLALEDILRETDEQHRSGKTLSLDEAFRDLL